MLLLSTSDWHISLKDHHQIRMFSSMMMPTLTLEMNDRSGWTTSESVRNTSVGTVNISPKSWDQEGYWSGSSWKNLFLEGRSLHVFKELSEHISLLHNIVKTDILLKIYKRYDKIIAASFTGLHNATPTNSWPIHLPSNWGSSPYSHPPELVQSVQWPTESAPSLQICMLHFG